MNPSCCNEALDMLLEYLEGSLPEDEQERIGAHFDACPPCLEFVESYKKTASLCRKSLRKSAPPEITHRVMLYLRKNIQEKPSKDG